MEELTLAPETTPASPTLDISATVTPRDAQLSKKIYFWHNPKTNHILQGAPPQFQPLQGYQVIECNHVWEAERWSKRLNDQDKRYEMATKEERDAIEAAQIADARANIRHLLTDARGMRRHMLEFALRKCDEADEKRRIRNNDTERESYLHAEAFEEGK